MTTITNGNNYQLTYSHELAEDIESVHHISLLDLFSEYVRFVSVQVPANVVAKIRSSSYEQPSTYTEKKREVTCEVWKAWDKGRQVYTFCAKVYTRDEDGKIGPVLVKPLNTIQTLDEFYGMSYDPK
jgi:hypothetical protein